MAMPSLPDDRLAHGAGLVIDDRYLRVLTTAPLWSVTRTTIVEAFGDWATVRAELATQGDRKDQVGHEGTEVTKSLKIWSCQ